ncbi:MAG: hypothetical protein IJZ10_07050 [Thermoguttaceae bacterium]|nr:hypothetical protein [Thermoguttaceae bacterium]
MAQHKRNTDLENADEKKKKNVKARGGKRLRTGFATLTICAAAFGAYYSPHFRAASSDWLERWRGDGAESATDGGLSEENGAPDDAIDKALAQAPSFRDFLTDEYGEEGARELLGIDETSAGVPTVSNAGVGFADYVAAETNASEGFSSQSVAPSVDAASLPVAPSVDAASLPVAPEPTASFADYVAAETNASEGFSSQSVSPSDDATSLPVAPSVDAASLPDATEPTASFADYVAAENDGVLNVDKTELASSLVAGASDVENEDETALAARLQDEMAERGVGNPRIERWGERFWRASGFATTSEGVATFCEAVDVDPTSAQRAALAKFDAAKF